MDGHGNVVVHATGVDGQPIIRMNSYGPHMAITLIAERQIDVGGYPQSEYMLSCTHTAWQGTGDGVHDRETWGYLRRSGVLMW